MCWYHQRIQHPLSITIKYLLHMATINQLFLLSSIAIHLMLMVLHNSGWTKGELSHLKLHCRGMHITQLAITTRLLSVITRNEKLPHAFIQTYMGGQLMSPNVLACCSKCHQVNRFLCMAKKERAFFANTQKHTYKRPIFVGHTQNTKCWPWAALTIIG